MSGSERALASGAPEGPDAAGRRRLAGRGAAVAHGDPWRAHLRAVEQALGRRDVDGARRAWEAAHLAAVESAGWEGLIATGHACLRIGGNHPAPGGAEPSARRAFFAALYRACRENSFEGVMRTVDAFLALGDQEVVDECLGLAELLVEGDEPRRRLAVLGQRLGRAPGQVPGGAWS